MSSDFEIDLEVYYLVSTFFLSMLLNKNNLDIFSVKCSVFSGSET